MTCPPPFAKHARFSAKPTQGRRNLGGRCWKRCGVSWNVEVLREGAFGFGFPVRGGPASGAEAPFRKNCGTVSRTSAERTKNGEKVGERGREPFPEKVSAHLGEEPDRSPALASGRGRGGPLRKIRARASFAFSKRRPDDE